MKPSKAKLQDYFKEMTHFDPDNMEMGAKQIAELVTTSELKISEDQKLCDRIRQAFMKQMDSNNNNVHSNAVTCVSQMVPFMPLDQVKLIFSRIIGCISNSGLDEYKRSIYGTCASVIISSASEGYGMQMSQLFVDSINKLMDMKEKHHEIQIILVNVILQYIKKWPGIAADSRIKYNKKWLLEYLVNNVEGKYKQQLVTKSQNTLGKYTIILNRTQLNELLYNVKYGLIGFIIRNRDNISKLKQLRNGIICLSQVLQSGNSQLREYIIGIYKQLSQTYNYMINQDDIDSIDLICDILEFILKCYSFIVKSYSRILGQKQMNQLISIAKPMLEYDTEKAMRYITLDNHMQQQYYAQEAYDYYDNDLEVQDKCWKIRRAALFFICHLIKRNSSFKNQLINSQSFLQLLGSKLVEENNSVGEMAIRTFTTIIQSISIIKHDTECQEYQLADLNTRRISSGSKQFGECLFQQFIQNVKIIFGSSKFKDPFKTQTSKTLLKYVALFSKQTPMMRKFLDDIVFTSIKGIKITQNIDQTQNLILVIKHTVSSEYPFKLYQAFVDDLILLTSKHHKIAAASYQCITSILFHFNSVFFEHRSFDAVINNMTTKLRQKDADRSLKNSLHECLGIILQNYLTKISCASQYCILKGLEQKLELAPEKKSVLASLSKIDNNFIPDVRCALVLQKILSLSSQYITNANYDLRLNATQVVQKLTFILKKQINSNLANQLLKTAEPLFHQGKVPGFVQILMAEHKTAFKPYVNSLIITADINCIKTMINLGITNANQVVNILKQENNHRRERAQKISQIFGTIKISQQTLLKECNQTEWGRICVGALGYIGQQSTLNQLIKMIMKTKDQEMKRQAAFSLGLIALKNQSHYLPIIKSKAESTQDYYIFIYSIKKMLDSAHELTDAIGLLNWLFDKAERSFDGQATYYLLSQCVGKVALLKPSVIPKVLEIGRTSQNKSVVVVNSLRYSVQLKTHQMELEQHIKFISAVMQFMNHKSINVRYGAVKSLNAIVPYFSQQFRRLIDKKFWQLIERSVHIDRSLIVEVDYGISKEKKDTGKNLRLQSFNLLISLAKYTRVDQTCIEGLIKACLANINEQTSTDLVLKRLQCLEQLCQTDFSSLTAIRGEFVSKLGPQEGLLKPLQTEKKENQDRVEIYLRNIFKCLMEINAIAEKQNQQFVLSLIREIKDIPRFKAIFDKMK